MWVRGLKLNISLIQTHIYTSHPMWVRGLKQTRNARITSHDVAPYVGAWIETNRGSPVTEGKRVAPYVGAWIET